MKKALEKFVKQFEDNNEVIGILLCGSYAVGLENKQSDIDIRLLMKDTFSNSIKGLIEIDGFSFSYLGRTKKVFLDKFNTDFFNNSKIEARNFYFGKILKDTEKKIKEIKEISTFYFNTNFIIDIPLEQKKEMMYSLYKRTEYLSTLKKDSPFFIYNYMLFMKLSILYYSKVLRIDLDYSVKLDKMLNNKNYLKTYKFLEFPDKQFQQMWLESLMPNNINFSNVQLIFDYLKLKIYNFNEKNFIMYWQI